MRKFIGWVHQVTCALWAEFVRNPRLYALLAGQPIILATIIWIVTIVSQARWNEAAIQLDILKWLIMALAVTHAIVAIAMAAVRVKGTGPGGFSLDVGGDDDDDQHSVDAQSEGQVTITPEAKT